MTTFPDAPDFSPGSEPWRRATEDAVAALERENEILRRNFRSLTRSIAAANKATHLRISKLGGVEIQPGTPINVQVFPYAYFTTNGYPAAGARVYWGDQHDADKYEIWLSRTSAPGETGYGDSPTLVVAQNATADIRGLECLTDYELAIRAVAPGGTYGFFTATVPFTTPNELTMIPWLGNPYLTWHDNFASIQWEWTEDYVPAYTEYTETATPNGVANSIDAGHWGNHARGVLAENGNIYYPPGRGDYFAAYNANAPYSRGVILDPSTDTATVSDYGLAALLDYGGGLGVGNGIGWIYGGALGGDGYIYWNARISIDDSPNPDINLNVIISLNPDTETATYTDTGDTLHYPVMATGGDGRVYCYPDTGIDTDGFLVIEPFGAMSVDYLGLTPAPGEDYGQAVTDANGDIWFMPLNSDNFLVIRTTGIPTAEYVPVDYPGGWLASDFGAPLRAPVLGADEKVYCFGWKSAPSAPGTTIWFSIDADGNQEYGEFTGTGAFNQAVLGSDGIIRGFGYGELMNISGMSTGGTAYNDSIASFNPATGEGGIIDMGSQVWKSDHGVASADGTIYFRITRDLSTDSGSSDKFVVLETAAIEHEATGTTEIPNYLKHMQVQRSTESGWTTVGTLAEPGFIMDPFATIGDLYRFVPLSTAGTTGDPSEITELTG